MKDTIAAIATASGKAGIAIVRISGEKAFRVLADCFRTASGTPLLPGRLRYGHVTDADGGFLDEAMAVCMQAPNSYTREDVAEIQCHGGSINGERVLKRVLEAGARPALPGEFTRRAFENGRIDLSQAEAVMALIGADSQAAARAAQRQMAGGVSRLVDRACEGLLSMLALIEAGNDYPEEIEEEATLSQLLPMLKDVEKELGSSLNEKWAHILRSGASAVLCGRPNTGKSSLMNAILESERAIVTDIPGTTRDTLSEYLEIDGLRVTITDTAGQRDALDPVEQMGIEKARRAEDTADLVIIVLDASCPLGEEDKKLLARADERCLVLLNKSDLPAVPQPELMGLPVLKVSAKTGEGLQALRECIRDRLSGPASDEALLTGERQIALCREALSLVRRSRKALEAGCPADIASVDLQGALEALWSMVGRNVRESVIDQVFSTFCVGK